MLDGLQNVVSGSVLAQLGPCACAGGVFSSRAAACHCAKSLGVERERAPNAQAGRYSLQGEHMRYRRVLDHVTAQNAGVAAYTCKLHNERELSRAT